MRLISLAVAALLAAPLFGGAAPAAAQTRGTPSICVGCETGGAPTRGTRRAREGVVRPQAPRRRVAAPRRPVVPIPRGSGIESAASANRSLLQQQEGVRASQQTQFEINQIRQGLSASPSPIGVGSPNCLPGQIGC